MAKSVCLTVAGGIAGAVALFAAPAGATTWLVLGTAIAQQTPTNPPGTTRLEGVPFSGQAMSFAFTIDDTVSGTPAGAPGGFGESSFHAFAVTSFAVQVGAWSITRTPASVGGLFIINDGGAGPGNRVDQLTLTEGASFVSGFQPHLQTDAPLAEDAFVSSFVFGRTEIAPAATPPTLLTSTAIPPLDQIWLNGPTFLTFDVRAGTPTSRAELSALPLARFNGTQLSFAVFALQQPGGVPEPATWGLFIAGFGVVGANLRRRRRGVAA